MEQLQQQTQQQPESDDAHEQDGAVGRILDALSRAERPEAVCAALLLITTQQPTPSLLTAVFPAIKPSFLSKLLSAGKAGSALSSNQSVFRSIAVSLLASFATVPAIVQSPLFAQYLTKLADIFMQYVPMCTAAQSEAPQSSSDPAAVGTDASDSPKPELNSQFLHDLLVIFNNLINYSAEARHSLLTSSFVQCLADIIGTVPRDSATPLLASSIGAPSSAVPVGEPETMSSGGDDIPVSTTSAASAPPPPIKPALASFSKCQELAVASLTALIAISFEDVHRPSSSLCNCTLEALSSALSRRNDRFKFFLCGQLNSLLGHINHKSTSAEFLRKFVRSDSLWVSEIATGVTNIIRSKLGAAERSQVLQLVAAVTELLAGIDWLLTITPASSSAPTPSSASTSSPGSSSNAAQAASARASTPQSAKAESGSQRLNSAFPLVVNIVSIELRMHLEDRKLTQIQPHSTLIISCFLVIETTIRYLASLSEDENAASTGTSGSQSQGSPSVSASKGITDELVDMINKLQRPLNEAVQAVMILLSALQESDAPATEVAQPNQVQSSESASSSSAQPVTPNPAVPQALPTPVTDDQLAKLAVEPIILAAIRLLGSWLAEETASNRDEVLALAPFLARLSTVSGAQEESASAQEDAIPAMVRFLLPGLCHLAADDASREILLQTDLVPKLASYLASAIQLLLRGHAQDRDIHDVNLLCGVLLTIAVTSPVFLNQHAVFRDLHGLLSRTLWAAHETTQRTSGNRDDGREAAVTLLFALFHAPQFFAQALLLSLFLTNSLVGLEPSAEFLQVAAEFLRAGLLVTAELGRDLPHRKGATTPQDRQTEASKIWQEIEEPWHLTAQVFMSVMRGTVERSVSALVAADLLPTAVSYLRDLTASESTDTQEIRASLEAFLAAVKSVAGSHVALAGVFSH
eukprot:m.889493 g.889493  ORF g.889493 m.889493 type:complete len:924 (+) comp59943_c0_seq9:63-2834(+)